MQKISRCAWATNGTELMHSYHDKEWGVPTHDDNQLFEILILDGAQAGLSWNTILNKRENYRKAFDDFEVSKVAKYNSSKIEKLMQNEGLVRNRLKINSAVRNAKVFLEIQKEFGTFDRYLWSFANYTPINNKIKKASDIPAHTHLSVTISKDLKKRGMNFVGSTIIYAIMQAAGLVNDHEKGCFKYKELVAKK
jgi:DNA-3-methyladenine glycosylase I